MLSAALDVSLQSVAICIVDHEGKVRPEQKENPGRISQAGDRDVRATLMRSIAWSSLKASGVRLMKTKGRRSTAVAAARKIAVVLHRMGIDGSDLRPGSQEAAA